MLGESFFELFENAAAAVIVVASLLLLLPAAVVAIAATDYILERRVPLS